MVTPPVEVHDDRVRLAVVDEGFAPRPIGFRAPSSTDEGGWARSS